MTTLDQAFIKAYGLSEGIPVPTIAQSTRPIPLSQAIHARGSGPAAPSTEACREAAARARQHDQVGLPNPGAVDALADRVAEVRQDSAGRVAPTRTSEPIGKVAARRGPHRLEAPGVLGRGSRLSLDQLDLPPGIGAMVPERPASAAPPASPAPLREADIEEAIDALVIEPDEIDEPEQFDEEVEPSPIDWADAAAEALVEETIQAEAEVLTVTEPEGADEILNFPTEAIEEQAAAEPEEPPQDTVDEAQLAEEPVCEEPVHEEQPADEQVTEEQSAEPVPAVDEAPVEKPVDAGPFEPALQTDRFDWPAVCNKLAQHAKPQIGRLADALETGLQRGRKVVGLGGLARGEGCTTLLLCVARQLAARGLRTVVIDADAEQPQVAASLGLAPEATWQDLASGSVPLQEAVIESVEDRLSVLPCRQNAGRRGRGNAELFDDATTLARLRSGYDLVLVDLGPLNRKPLLRRLADGRAIDAVLLVHNVRTTPTKQIVRLSERLSKAGVAQAGIAENFVPASAPVAS